MSKLDYPQKEHKTMLTFTTQGSTMQRPHNDPNILVAPHVPGVFALPTMNPDKLPDPFIYEPMGNAGLSIGQKVQVRSMDGSGKWCYAYVLKTMPNGDGYAHPWYLVGTKAQIEMGI